MSAIEEEPLALHSWTKANAVYYSCKVKCGWSAKACKAVCLTKYYENLKDKIALFEEEEPEQAAILAAVNVEALPEQGSSIPSFVAALVVLLMALGAVGYMNKKNKKDQVITGSYVSDKALISEKLMKEEEFLVLP
jgi:hypothetical protein